MTHAQRASQPSAPNWGQRKGGLHRRAFAPSPQSITQAARSARWQGYVDRILERRPELDPDNPADAAEIEVCAKLLQRVDMIEMAAKAVKARQMAAEARRMAAEAEADLAEVQDEATA
jgi:hypothetical protein